MFTQPLMYKAIKAHKNAHQRFTEKLLAEGAVGKVCAWWWRRWV
jgi:2-oxoglutarate dehydrogenase complex dehydrogenase (E1) component-like enzyme